MNYVKTFAVSLAFWVAVIVALPFAAFFALAKYIETGMEWNANIIKQFKAHEYLK